MNVPYALSRRTVGEAVVRRLSRARDFRGRKSENYDGDPGQGIGDGRSAIRRRGASRRVRRTQMRGSVRLLLAALAAAPVVMTAHYLYAAGVIGMSLTGALTVIIFMEILRALTVKEGF